MKNLFLLIALASLGASPDARAQSEATESARPQTGPQRGTYLFVRTKPDGAKVLIDGKQVGVSDDLFPVDPGVRRIIVELEGHDPNGREVTIRAWCTPTSRAQLDIYTPDGEYIDEPGETIDPAWSVWVDETGDVTWTIPIPLAARFGPGAEGDFVINVGLRSGKECSYEGTYRMTR